MEENYMGEKKSKKGTVFIIVLLILIILGLVGYICYDKGLIFKTEKEVVKKEKKAKEKSVEFTDEELDKYVNYISPMNVTGHPSDLLYNTDSVSVDELSAAKKIEYIGTAVFDKREEKPNSSVCTIAESDLKEIFEEVYGPNTYEKATFSLGCGNFVLNENDGKYYLKADGCGGTTATTVSNEIIGYKATKKKLEITTAYAFHNAGENKIYKDYNESVVLDDYKELDYNKISSYLKEYVKKNKDKLNHIVYTFESKDGKNYYFKGFKNNK